MAVGGPENDVFAAADAVLARGERPTVERVRSELGARQSGAGWWAARSVVGTFGRTSECRNTTASITRRSFKGFCRGVAAGDSPRTRNRDHGDLAAVQAL